MIPVTEQLCLCSAATAGLYGANLCSRPNQVRGLPSPTPVIPGTHILCRSLRGWKDRGKKVELPFFWTNHKWTRGANFILSPCFKRGKIRWPDTDFLFLFHIMQLNLPPVTEAGGSTSQSSPGICSSSLFSIPKRDLSTDAAHCSGAAAPRGFLTRKSTVIYNVW